MKKLLTLLTLLITCTPCFATNSCYVYYPMDEKIVNTSYSTGGGDSAIVYVEVDVTDKNGNWKKYICKELSMAGAMGWSRLTMPSHIYFVKSKSLNNSIRMNCK